MLGFDYFRQQCIDFVPKTVQAALKAFEAFILPIEAFIHLGTSIKPLDIEPYNILEIEKFLNNKELDIKTTLLLIKILNKLVKSEDTELALFAAEGINALEKRFYEKIEKQKKYLSDDNPEILSKLAFLFYDLNLIQSHTKIIAHFYLKESYNFIRQYHKVTKLNHNELILYLRILIELNDFTEAIRFIRLETPPNDATFLLLEAEIEFKKKNFERVQQLFVVLKKAYETLNSEEKKLVDYWLEMRIEDDADIEEI